MLLPHPNGATIQPNGAKPSAKGLARTLTGITHYVKSTVLREIFTGPNFCEIPVSPPEEIFAVLIFAFSPTY